jgi:hypothetical protein
MKRNWFSGKILRCHPSNVGEPWVRFPDYACCIFWLIFEIDTFHFFVKSLSLPRFFPLLFFFFFSFCTKRGVFIF